MDNEVGKELLYKGKEVINNFLETADHMLNNEFTQLALQSSKIYSLLSNANKTLMEKKFSYFLKGFSEDKEPTEEQINKLIKYIDDESKAEFISDTFSKILLSNSSKACLLMGTLLKSMVDKGGTLQHSKLICISALKDFFDIDFINYKYLFDFLDWKQEKVKFKMNNKNDKYKNISFAQLSIFAKEKEVSFSSLWLTIEKATSSQLLKRYYEPDLDISYDKDTDMTDTSGDIDEYYSFSDAGLLLKEYLDRII